MSIDKDNSCNHQKHFQHYCSDSEIGEFFPRIKMLAEKKKVRLFLDKTQEEKRGETGTRDCPLVPA
jgi:hypothetical protein